MLRNVLLLLLTISSFVPSKSGLSSLVFSIDVDDSANPISGIQPNVAVSPGSTVIASIYAELTDTTSIATFNYSVQFDTSELTYVSRTETPNALTGLSEADTSQPDDLGTGTLRRFDGTTFADGPVGPFGPVKVGEIVFTATSPSGTAGELDVRPGLFETGFDLFYDNGFANITSQVTFLSGSVSVGAVPEPSSLLVVSALGLVSVATYRGKRKRIR